MANEAQGYAVVDPLANYWGLSLFPQTSGVPPDPSKPYNPDVDLDTIHSHLRSMALRSPSKLLEQAKSIIDGNPGLFNSQVLGDPASYEINDVVSEEVKENPRERRPALGHKRARFSLKPNKNHPPEILQPSLDIDNLKDPEEFFMAHERLENAKREIQKQMGSVLFEPNQNNTSSSARQRRPGLLGNNQRRSVRYKHRYSIESDNNENVPFSQETFKSGALDPVGESIEEAGVRLASPGSELTDSPAVEENKFNNILDELLHSEDLVGAQAITLLQENLQIKPIVLEKLSIPDLPNNRVIDLKSLGGNLSKPRKRKPLMNIDNLLKEMNNITPVKFRQDVGSPGQQLASPTPPKSPFTLLSSLQKRISQSKPSVDPFSAVDHDCLSTRNSFLTDMTEKELNLGDSGKPSDKLNGPSAKDTKISDEETVRNFAITCGKSKEDNSGEPAFGTNLDSNESHVDIEVDTGDRNMGNKVMDDIVSRPNPEANEPCKFEDTVRTCAITSGKSKEDDSKELAFGTNVESNKSCVDMEVDVGGGDMGNKIVDDTISRPSCEANEPCELVDKVQEVMTSEETYDPDLNLVNPLELGPARFEANGKDKHTTTSDDGPEQCLQVQEKTEGSKVSVEGQRKVISPSRKRKDKGLSQRQSLAVAGTSWESGVRRSTRMRTRPLEYWKGERPVYGRIHESLATVIGVKYMSPGTADGKPTMKVKSYVAEKYKELLELASQY